ncbi:MAG: hypothetical protein Q8M09_17585 [Pseudomonadota bacterium]|nr:hypothetical protein [Pseudomonadota bacterium]MDP1906031.1 hypothetical protein [Pseudomonadota bacterium]MDP2352502.1 hypothetical protein [Pseudomonadota bacterium]
MATQAAVTLLLAEQFELPADARAHGVTVQGGTPFLVLRGVAGRARFRVERGFDRAEVGGGLPLRGDRVPPMAVEKGLDRFRWLLALAARHGEQ